MEYLEVMLQLLSLFLPLSLSSDGLGRTGTFCAMFTVLERLKAEQVIDVFSTVKTLRIQRPGLINDLVSIIQKIIIKLDDYFNIFNVFLYRVVPYIYYPLSLSPLFLGSIRIHSQSSS